jgi:hypothetical protein
MACSCGWSAWSAVQRIVASSAKGRIVTRLGVKARRELAERLRAALVVLEQGDLKVSGSGHSRESTRIRLKARIADLERKA